MHEYEYVRHVQECVAEGKGYLDSDTVLSEKSWVAACKSAGAVMEAVDEVVSGRARQAFVAGEVKFLDLFLIFNFFFLYPVLGTVYVMFVMYGYLLLDISVRYIYEGI